VRVLAVFLGVGVAVLVGLTLWRLWQTPNGPAPNSGEPPSERVAPAAAPVASELPVPRTAEERERVAYAAQRRGFLVELQQALTPLRAACRTGKRLDTLEILVEPGAEADVEALRDTVLNMNASAFGYARICILRKPAPGSGIPAELVAEVTRNEDGRWITFLR